MDILISSNLERMLYELSGCNDEEVGGYMAALSADGTYTVSGEIKAKLEELFAAGYCDDEGTKATIEKMWREHGYLIDPHTAVAFHVLEQYRAQSGDMSPTVVVSTASPFKFCDSVLSALGVEEVSEGTAIIDQLSAVTGVAAPAPLSGLKDKRVRFDKTVAKEHMVDQVLEMLK